MSKKLSKRQFRIEVFKGVFQSDFYDESVRDEQLAMLCNEEVNFDMADISEDDANAISNKCKDIFANIDDIDKVIEDNLDKWSINRIGKVELALLRVAVYELRYDNLDAGIAINEAVGIAKIYGGDKSGPFVNGVLAKVVK